MDEYETLRLIDLEGSTQEQCAASMQVARTTVQGIYNSARRKVADALVNGKVLQISGGDYMLYASGGKKCDHCRNGHCPRCHCKKQHSEEL